VHTAHRPSCWCSQQSGETVSLNCGLLFIPQIVYKYGESRWNNTDSGNRKTRRKTSPSAISTTINPTCINPGANPVLHDNRPVKNHLSYGTALHWPLSSWSYCWCRSVLQIIELHKGRYSLKVHAVVTRIKYILLRKNAVLHFFPITFYSTQVCFCVWNLWQWSCLPHCNPLWAIIPSPQLHTHTHTHTSL
jgi:hypothetical protein